MRISQLSLEGRGAWPDLHIDSLSPQLNVFFADPRGGKSTVARLLSHLLYGKSESSWRLQFGQSVPMAEGKISLDSKRGQFVLRRHSDAGQPDAGQPDAGRQGVSDLPYSKWLSSRATVLLPPRGSAKN
ncbi:MAG: hypothetical protein GXP24_10275, partial [Planctomycetes bacterium]|nr:hypothetical protein [Planctomycetota bacterium]